MYVQSALLDLYVQMHNDDIQREFAKARLVAEATRGRGGRSLRAQVAERLYALAALIEGQEQRSFGDAMTA